MEYFSLVETLRAMGEEDFAAFQARLIPIARDRILGVRTPVLRALVKEYKGEWKTLLTFPDEYYEVTFIKLNACALLPYEEFSSVVKECVQSVDNWAICDTFKARCIATHREEFLPFIHEFLGKGGFFARYALVTLLSFYVEKEYLPEIFAALAAADTRDYYVSMAAAWLTAEVLTKFYEEGIAFLEAGRLDEKTHNRAIRKARESYRVSAEKKEELLRLKKRE